MVSPAMEVPPELPSLAAVIWVVFPPFPETVDQDTVVVVAAVDVPFQSPLSSPVGKGDLHQDHHTAATDASVVAATVAPPVTVEISLVLLPRCQGPPPITPG